MIICITKTYILSCLQCKISLCIYRLNNIAQTFHGLKEITVTATELKGKKPINII